MCQVMIERAHWWADAHIVIVQDDKQRQAGLHAAIVQGFECHARSHGTIANDGDTVALLALGARP